jgi:hypothetical protein
MQSFSHSTTELVRASAFPMPDAMPFDVCKSFIQIRLTKHRMMDDFDTASEVWRCPVRFPKCANEAPLPAFTIDTSRPLCEHETRAMEKTYHFGVKVRETK